ncbi:MAG: cysteine hydrolase family protein [Armatimonadota bacterium]
MNKIDNNIRQYVSDRQPFLEYMKRWENSLPSLKLADIVNDAGGQENTAIICADMVMAFCCIGGLASQRVAALINPVVDIFKLAHSHGIKNFILPQDNHPTDSIQFRAYGPHSMAGSDEAKTIPELTELPFSNLFKIVHKNNLNPGIDTEFPGWLDNHPNMKAFIVVGDCTDLCIYQTATYMVLRASQYHLDYRVIIPANCVDTFDTPLDRAEKEGIMPHDAGLLHPLFLHHMALNYIKVVREITG